MIMKSERIRQAFRAHEDMRNVYRTLVRKSERNRLLRRSRHRYGNNIKVNLNEI
jgi:hypothetical protein